MLQEGPVPAKAFGVVDGFLQGQPVFQSGKAVVRCKVVDLLLASLEVSLACLLDLSSCQQIVGHRLSKRLQACLLLLTLKERAGPSSNFQDGAPLRDLPLSPHGIEMVTKSALPNCSGKAATWPAT